MSRQILISGVGRSGTTFAYDVLLRAAKAENSKTLGRYEPFLWGEPTWDRAPSEIGGLFGSTSSMSSIGIANHLTAPLFLRDAGGLDTQFLDSVFPQGQDVIAKFIRASGRLAAFLRSRPNLTGVHIVRNPLDVVNSGLNYFSFFGAEFHPSDLPRFNRETAGEFPEIADFEGPQSVAQQALKWCRFMTEAALRTADEFEDRVLVVPYEWMMSQPKTGLRAVLEFVGLSSSIDQAIDYTQRVGPKTSSLQLSQSDRDTILPFVDQYFDDARIFGRCSASFDVSSECDEVIARYAECKAGPAFDWPLDPGLAPTQLRARLRSANADNQKTAEQSNALAQLQSRRHAEIGDRLDALELSISSVGEVAVDLSEMARGARTDDVHSKLSTISTAIGDFQKREAEVLAARAETSQLRGQLVAAKAELSAMADTVDDLKAEKSVLAQRAQAEINVVIEDLDASATLVSRLKDRIAALREEQSNQSDQIDSLRLGKRRAEEELKRSKDALAAASKANKLISGQASELASILAPRLWTIFSLRPLRYVFQQRQKIKSGQAQVNTSGIVQGVD